MLGYLSGMLAELQRYSGGELGCCCKSIVQRGVGQMVVQVLQRSLACAPGITSQATKQDRFNSCAKVITNNNMMLRACFDILSSVNMEMAGADIME